MNVIVFASRKGGSGKSTLTAHLAAHANRPSRRCMLIDADPQGSISLWHKLRGTAEPQLRQHWESEHPGSAWERVKAAFRRGWDRATS